VTKIAANSRQNYGIKFLSFLSLKRHFIRPMMYVTASPLFTSNVISQWFC